MLKINWKVRFRNGYFILSLTALVVGFVYDILMLLGAVPAVEEEALMAVVKAVLTVLSMVGVVTDPTTKGIGDSVQAMGYQKPKQ